MVAVAAQLAATKPVLVLLRMFLFAVLLPGRYSPSLSISHKRHISVADSGDSLKRRVHRYSTTVVANNSSS